MAYTSFHNATVAFGFSDPSPTADDKPSVQNAVLRRQALDNLVQELDDLHRRAGRAANTLRNLRPLLPAGKN